jgi:protein involved in polysaccharide export with SLBB domain
LENRASLREAEIARLPQNNDGGRLAVTERVSLDSTYRLASNVGVRVASGVVQAGAQREVTLHPYDNVLILSQPDFDAPRHVAVAGEVQRPGSYVLLTKGDRLTDVIGRAGGLTSSAYREGIVFYRRQNRVGRVGVDFARVMRDTSHRDNLILQDGDSIFLPPYSAIVEVQGAVSAPRGVTWVPGANLDYYVRAAGGATRTGDLAHSYVTQPDGSVESVVERTLWPNTVPVPRAGSVVYVSEKPVEPRVDAIARLSVIAQIVGSLVAIVAITRR